MREVPQTRSQQAALAHLRSALVPFLRMTDIWVQVIAGALQDRLDVRPFGITSAMVAEYAELVTMLRHTRVADGVDVEELQGAWARVAEAFPVLADPPDS